MDRSTHQADRPLRRDRVKNSNAVRAAVVTCLFFSHKSFPRSIGARAVVESPDTFHSRPESKKPFQLHLPYRASRVALTGTRARAGAGANTSAYHQVCTRDARDTALCELARVNICVCILCVHVCVNVCMIMYMCVHASAKASLPVSLSLYLYLSRPPKRVREAASYMIHSLYKNNRLSSNRRAPSLWIWRACSVYACAVHSSAWRFQRSGQNCALSATKSWNSTEEIWNKGHRRWQWESFQAIVNRDDTIFAFSNAMLPSRLANKRKTQMRELARMYLITLVCVCVS